MKILTIVGARPQFIKASVVSKALAQKSKITEILLHTGQHFDSNMSDIFFKELEIPKPDILLNINGGTHAQMTGKMLIEIEQALIEHKPDRVLVYGDTNSTLSGALAAAKLHIPVAHIEAGLRSFNRQMPEEINRILTDQLSDILFCPTDTAVNNLQDEGFLKKKAKVLKVGDVMQDSSQFFAKVARKPENLNQILDNYCLVTIHRAENTDNKDKLKNIVNALNKIHQQVSPVVMPIHPRTRKLISDYGLELKVHTIDPVGYLEMIWLIQNSHFIMTDSGGLQKEAYFFEKPCVTLREETEWTELVHAGANTLVGTNDELIVKTATERLNSKIIMDDALYGGGMASTRIAEELVR